ncbi:hypothetical protein [Arthrobacter sp. H35-D1]|nr:hypothetical protein [Arthrobacter sp. H35-D1]MDJ0311657.1 hypothetical protein [Arthrobacter sp. H35-D1]
MSAGGPGKPVTTVGWRAARPTKQTDPWVVLGTGIIPMGQD